MSITVHAHHVLFRYYIGRGAFESMGAGLEMKPGDIAFKVIWLYNILYIQTFYTCSQTLRTSRKKQVL